MVGSGGIVRGRGARRNGRAADPASRIALGRDGERLELVVDGIAYSTFHAEKPWSGYVWDALAAAGLLARGPSPSVLLLGCGAGTVLALLRRLRPGAQLTAVELEPRVIELARERFRLDESDAEIVESDGCEFLRRTRRRFDLVIDDMFCPGEDGLARPVGDEDEHLRLVATRLRPGGVAATNATTDDDPPGLERRVRRAYREVFPHRLALAPRRGFNVVIAGSARPLDAAAVLVPPSGLDVEDLRGLGGVRVRRA